VVLDELFESGGGVFGFEDRRGENAEEDVSAGEDVA